MGKNYYSNVTVHHKDVKIISNHFIYQIVSAWCKLSYNEPVNNIGNQIIWNNSRIRIDSNIIFMPKLYQAGVRFVSDLFDLAGSPLQFNAFKAKFHLDNFPFTIFIGLVTSIPVEWRHRDAVNITHQPHLSWFDRVLLSNSLSQFLYTHFVKLVATPPTCINRWNAAYNIDDDHWKNIFKAPFLSVREAKIQYFQFRCVHRILGTNSLLFQMNLSSSPLCSFCNSIKESINHIFWDCPQISSFILDVERAVFGNQFIFSCTDILFCYKFIARHPYNFLIYYMKYYIFSKRSEGET